MKYHKILIDELNTLIGKVNKLPPESISNQNRSIYLEGMCEALNVLVNRVANLKTEASEIIDAIIDRDSDLIRASANIREVFGLQENEVYKFLKDLGYKL